MKQSLQNALWLHVVKSDVSQHCQQPNQQKLLPDLELKGQNPCLPAPIQQMFVIASASDMR